MKFRGHTREIKKTPNAACTDNEAQKHLSYKCNKCISVTSHICTQKPVDHWILLNLLQASENQI